MEADMSTDNPLSKQAAKASWVTASLALFGLLLLFLAHLSRSILLVLVFVLCIGSLLRNSERRRCHRLSQSLLGGHDQHLVRLNRGLIGNYLAFLLDRLATDDLEILVDLEHVFRQFWQAHGRSDLVVDMENPANSLIGSISSIWR